MNPRDKMPLEVTPVYFKLQRYNAANVTPATATPGNQPGGDPNQNPAAGQPPAGQSTPPPAATQPAAGDTAAQQQTPASPQY
jgi:hypothetical protein